MTFTSLEQFQILPLTSFLSIDFCFTFISVILFLCLFFYLLFFRKFRGYILPIRGRNFTESLFIGLISIIENNLGEEGLQSFPSLILMPFALFFLALCFFLVWGKRPLFVKLRLCLHKIKSFILGKMKSIRDSLFPKGIKNKYEGPIEAGVKSISGIYFAALLLFIFLVAYFLGYTSFLDSILGLGVSTIFRVSLFIWLAAGNFMLIIASEELLRLFAGFIYVNLLYFILILKFKVEDPAHGGLSVTFVVTETLRRKFYCRRIRKLHVFWRGYSPKMSIKAFVPFILSSLAVFHTPSNSLMAFTLLASIVYQSYSFLIFVYLISFLIRKFCHNLDFQVYLKENFGPKAQKLLGWNSPLGFKLQPLFVAGASIVGSVLVASSSGIGQEITKRFLDPNDEEKLKSIKLNYKSAEASLRSSIAYDARTLSMKKFGVAVVAVWHDRSLALERYNAALHDLNEGLELRNVKLREQADLNDRLRLHHEWEESRGKTLVIEPTETEPWYYTKVDRVFAEADKPKETLTPFDKTAKEDREDSFSVELYQEEEKENPPVEATKPPKGNGWWPFS